MKLAMEKDCSGMVSMHYRGSEDCTVLVVMVCLHGIPVLLDLAGNQMKEDPHRSCSQSHLALSTDIKY